MFKFSELPREVISGSLSPGQVAATIEASSSEAAVHWSEFITEFFGSRFLPWFELQQKHPRSVAVYGHQRQLAGLELKIWKIWKADFGETKLVWFCQGPFSSQQMALWQCPQKDPWEQALKFLLKNCCWRTLLYCYATWSPKKMLLNVRPSMLREWLVDMSKESRKSSAVSKFLSFRWKDVQVRRCFYNTSGTSIACCPRRYACDGRRMCLSAPSMSEHPRCKVVPSLW